METKSFISDDVIQRITSGNEPTQTKISLDVLKKVLKPHQLRNVLGGSAYCCVFCVDDNTTTCQPYGSCIELGNKCSGKYLPNFICNDGCEASMKK